MQHTLYVPVHKIQSRFTICTVQCVWMTAILHRRKFSNFFPFCGHDADMYPVQVVPKIFLEVSHSCIIFSSLFPQLIETFSLMCKLFAWWPVGTSRPYCLNTTLCLATVFNICVTQRAAYWLKTTHRDLKTSPTSRVETRWLMSLSHKHK
jgi:hypothetical protein